MMDRPPSKPLLPSGWFALPTPSCSQPLSPRRRPTKQLPPPSGPWLLEDMGVPAWHAAGWRGQGVKVAVLDSRLPRLQGHLGEALPEQVTARSFRDDGDLEAKDSQHGILCGEVVHAVAPDADLLLANWEPERPDRFAEAVSRRDGRARSRAVRSSCRRGATATAAAKCIRP